MRSSYFIWFDKLYYKKKNFFLKRQVKFNGVLIQNFINKILNLESYERK